jgi:predicted CopG family antitoxin
MNKVKINITIDEALYAWLNERRGVIPLSTYINHLLTERREGEELIGNYRKGSSSVSKYIEKTLERIKGGDRLLEILSKEYLKEI